MLNPPFLFRSKGFVALLFALNILVFLYLYQPHDRIREFRLQSSNPAESTAGNSTLGFDAILTVSPQKLPEHMRWRPEGILRAASRTGLHIQIPKQPIFTDEDVSAFLVNNVFNNTNHGAALCWMGHLSILREVVDKGYGSALILEDDADWDVDIRSSIPLFAEGVRNLTEHTRKGGAPAVDKRIHDFKHSPYGWGWDVLWIGHCSESFENLPTHSPVGYQDPIIPPYINGLSEKVSPDPHGYRYVHYSEAPICTFAYAVTGQAASWILSRDTHGTEQGWDLWLLVQCKQGILRCVSVTPELFHHHRMPGISNSLINKPNETGTYEHEVTENIWHSARCNLDRPDSNLITCMGDDRRDWVKAELKSNEDGGEPSGTDVHPEADSSEEMTYH